MSLHIKQLPPLSVGVCVEYTVCFSVLCVLSGFAIIPPGKKGLVAFTTVVFWMSCFCCRTLPLPRGAVGWSAVCDCDNACSYSLTN